MSEPCTIEPQAVTSAKYNVDHELELLGSDPVTSGFDSCIIEGFRNAPLFTGDALRVCNQLGVFSQRAVYGRIMVQECNGFPATVSSPKLYINTNAPFSGVTCGVQGSGKSHSTSVILESCLIRDERLGTLPAPLSALLFNFDTAAGAGHIPCEAANLAALDETRGGSATPPKVTVLVMPSSLRAMKKAYAVLPKVSVEALQFAPEDINGERLLAMMKVDQDQHMPLYMECIMNILRSMEDTFNYAEFRRQLSQQEFSGSQRSMLDLRLGLLDSCLQGGRVSNRLSNYFNKGQLTIIDLSSPFMDGSSACGFFDIILGIFIEAKMEVGKLVVLDEAHKYLTNSGSSSRLTDSLLSVIRQQRHLGTRVLISTQEPTVVPPQFLDLCSFVIAHRFSSPKWLDHLKQHVSSVDTQSFTKIFTLKTGEAMIFSPAGVGLRENSPEVADERACAHFGPGYLLVRSRARITRDGGRSLFAESGHTKPVVPLDEISQNSELPAESTDSSRQVLSPPTTLDCRSESAHSSDPINMQAGTPITRGAIHSEPPLVQIAERTKTSTDNVLPQCNANSPAPPVPTAPRRGTLGRPEIRKRFAPLITNLPVQGRISWTDLGTKLQQQQPAPYLGKLRDYLREAEAVDLVKLETSKGQNWVQALCFNEYYGPLIDTLRRLSEGGDIHPRRSVVAEQLKKHHPNAFTGTFKCYAQAAEAAGVIICDTIQERIRVP